MLEIQENIPEVILSKISNAFSLKCPHIYMLWGKDFNFASQMCHGKLPKFNYSTKPITKQSIRTCSLEGI